MTDMIVIDSGETGRLVIGWLAPLEEKIIASAVWLTVWIFALSYRTLKRVFESIYLLPQKGWYGNGKSELCLHLIKYGNSCSMRCRQPMSPLVLSQSKKDAQRL